jgi:hypothetical protein
LEKPGFWLNFVINRQGRRARREKTVYTEAEWPFLWILCPSCSGKLVKRFEAKPDPAGQWPAGVYFLPEGQNCALVAINQLPVNPDTLWLRVLGKGRTQEQAIAELEALPKGNPLRQNLGELLASWHVTIETSDNITEDDRELLMKRSPVYLRWREDTILKERREMIENFFNVRFGLVDSELSAIIEPMLQLPRPELSRLLLSASREELLERFGNP